MKPHDVTHFCLRLLPAVFVDAINFLKLCIHHASDLVLIILKINVTEKHAQYNIYIENKISCFILYPVVCEHKFSFAKNTKQDQPTHTCILIMHYILCYSFICLFHRDSIQCHLPCHLPT